MAKARIANGELRTMIERALGCGVPGELSLQPPPHTIQFESIVPRTTIIDVEIGYHHSI